MNRTESPLFEKLRSFEDPRPHLNEAKDALGRMFTLQKDLFLLDVELRTMNQLRRLAFIVAAILSLELMLGMSLGWVSWALHQRGWSPWVLALGSFLIFGALTLVFVSFAKKVGTKNAEEDDE